MLLKLKLWVLKVNLIGMVIKDYRYDYKSKGK